MLTQYDQYHQEVPGMSRNLEPTIALLPWGHVWEDFYDSIGVSFASFCNEMTGGWQFGYIDALKQAGIRTIVIYPSTRVTEPSHFTHTPTGAKIYLLPVPKSYSAIRHQMIDPYPSFGGNVKKLFGEVHGSRRLLFEVLKEVAPYLSTPLRLLASELKKEGCSAILCQEYEYFRFDACVMLGKLIGLPVFATFQGTNHDDSRLGSLVRSLSIQACAGLAIGPQTEIQRVLSRYNINPVKIAQIFNPIDLGLWEPDDRTSARSKLGIPEDAEVVVWHGRVEMEIKGLDILLEAWEQICYQRAERDLRLLLMGTGKDAEKLRQRIAAMPKQNVFWVDKYVNDRAEMRRFLSVGDVYAFPSRHEGFPVAPIEAMACGVPVVAAQAPGVPDIFEGGEVSGGLVVPCGDVKTFSIALGRLLDDRELRIKLGKFARHRVEKCFSLTVVGKQLRDFFYNRGMSA